MSEITNKNRPLAESVSEEIINYILQNNLKAGDKLPNEYILGETLGVGRSTIREAIKALISRNVLEIRRGAGTFVSEKQGVADDPLGLSFFQDKIKLASDLLDIRFLIEPEIASMAAIHATEEEIIEMELLCLEVEKLIYNRENHRQKDIEFHTAIARSSGNIVVPNLIPIINQAITLFMDITQRKLLSETVTTHREILESIKIHDSKGAHDAMYLHLLYNRRAIKKELG